MQSKKAVNLCHAIEQKYIQAEPLSTVLEDNLCALKRLQGMCEDLVIHRFLLYRQTPAALIFVEGMIDTNQCGLLILQPLTKKMANPPKELAEDLHVGQSRTCNTIDVLLEAVFNGHTAILVEGSSTATLTEIRSAVGRSISEPDMNRSVLGARESFVEKITLNILMLRRKVHDARLCVKNHFIGRRGQAKLCITYIRDIADPTIVAAIEKKIKAIDVDAILDIGQLSQYLLEDPSMPFTQILPVERADFAASALLEGRVVVFLDQCAQALILPVVFWDFFRAVDDPNEKPYAATVMRYLRLICFFASVLLPAWFIALVTYHPQLIPLKLALPLIQARSSAALSVTAEVLFIEILLAILTEASLRTPKQISQSIGLIGGVILGQALLSSNLATAPTLLIATASVIAQFAMPHYVVVRLMAFLRLAAIAAAHVYGLFGVSMLWFLLLCILGSMKTYSVPYLAPLGTYSPEHLRDMLILRRAPRHKKRTVVLPVQDQTRQV